MEDLILDGIVDKIQKKVNRRPTPEDIIKYNDNFTNKVENIVTVILEIEENIYKRKTITDFIGYEKNIITNEILLLKKDRLIEFKNGKNKKPHYRIIDFNNLNEEEKIIEISDSDKANFYSKYPNLNQNNYIVYGMKFLDNMEYEYLYYELNFKPIFFAQRIQFISYDSSIVLWSVFSKICDHNEYLAKEAYAISNHPKKSILHSKYYSEAKNLNNNYIDYKIIGEEYKIIGEDNLSSQFISVIELYFRFDIETHEISKVKRRRLRGNFLN